MTETNDNLRLKIGLEVHLFLDTEYKAFSLTKKAQSSYTSLGVLGALPQINTSAIKSCYKMARALNSDISEDITFERKSYFYFDLPRGYQLTQYSNPIGRNGYIFLFNLQKKIGIRTVVLEEDTAAHSTSENVDNSYSVSFNRLGAPLIEIVTHPEMKSAEEAIECIKMIRFLSFLFKLSKAELENGQLRVDLNVSLIDEKGEAKTGRAEIKNLASYRAIEQATSSIKKHFLDKLEGGNEDMFVNETFHWIEKEARLVVARGKMSESEYLFIPESCIPTIKLSSEEKQALIEEVDQDRLNNILSSIHKSKLADREKQEIISNSGFFWECYQVQQMLKDWANAYFLLKIFHSVGGNTTTFSNLLTFLTGLIEQLFKGKKITVFKFDNWKIRECCKKLSQSIVDVDSVIEFYMSLPTVTREDIIQLCEEAIEAKKEELLKLVEKPNKLSSYFLGLVRAKFEEKVEMSEAKLIVDMKMNTFIKKIKGENKKEEEENPEDEEEKEKKVSKLRQKWLDWKKAKEERERKLLEGAGLSEDGEEKKDDELLDQPALSSEETKKEESFEEISEPSSESNEKTLEGEEIVDSEVEDEGGEDEGDIEEDESSEV